MISNGIDLAAFTCPDRRDLRDQLRYAWGVPDSAVLLVMLARFAPPKDHATVLRALGCLAEKRADVHVAFCGNGPLAETVQLDAHRTGLARVVHLPGPLEPQLAYAAGDVALLASRSEGLPNALLEGMAMGLPCLATNVGGVPEVVAEGETGLLVPPADAPALAAAMETLADDAALRTRLGAQGRKRIETHFSLAAMICAYEALWDRLLGSA